MCLHQNETREIVVPANYQHPGQLVISGSIKGIEIACERMKAAGAKRALIASGRWCFHSPLMEPARQEQKAAVKPQSLILRHARFIKMWQLRQF